MRDACRVPAAVGAALMPDAHVGYGLPIGGVLALRERGDPVRRRRRHRLPHEAVGARHAGRSRSTTAANISTTARWNAARGSASASSISPPQSHAVMDEDWTVTRITREKKDTAWRQLGTSGSGNHFVEFGVLTLVTSDDDELGLDAGEYVALLSHSGSRGAGAAVCSTYSADRPAPAAEASTTTLRPARRGSISTARPARNTGRR